MMHEKLTEAIIGAAYEVQWVNYLKATGIGVGLRVNFGGRAQVKRRVFDPWESVYIRVQCRLCQGTATANEPQIDTDGH